MTQSIDSEPGLILHSRPYKENSLLVELYTLNYGRISAVARISSRISSRARGIYQPYVPLRLALSKGRGALYTLKEACIRRPAFRLEIPRVFSAFYINELMLNLVRISESDPRLFASYLKALERLERGDGESLVLRDFESDLIESLGYSISYECADGSELDKDEYYFYSVHSGFVLDSMPGSYTYKGSDLISLKNSLCSRQDGSCPASAGTHGLKLRKQLNRTVIDSLLNGRSLQSRELYAQYLMVK